MAQFEIIQDDIIRWTRGHAWQFQTFGPLFHAIFCDPPYHLTSITKRFGKEGSKPAKGGVYGRSAKGFMGKVWDGGNLSFLSETWKTLVSLLYPGGYIMAYASSRTYYEMAIAMKDAGLILHPSIFAWLYSSGFPKGAKVDTQIDRYLGEEREKEKFKYQDIYRLGGQNTRPWMEEAKKKGYHEKDSNTPVSDLAKAWQGHRYGLQALKPAIEPILLAQKPYEGKPFMDMMETGAGALWIDGGRLETDNNLIRVRNGMESLHKEGIRQGNRKTNSYENSEPILSGSDNGRWPSNFVLSHSPECNEDTCADDCPVKMLNIPMKAGGSVTPKGTPKTDLVYGKYDGYYSFSSYGDNGNLSRIFFQADWKLEIYEKLMASNHVFPVSKPQKDEKEAGLDSLEYGILNRTNPGGIENDPKWAPRKRKNIHPTIKPLTLNKYLTTLLLPPEIYTPRRILVPFAGSGSEMIGAILAGWDHVVGIEKDPEYAEIARHRVAFWNKQHTDDIDAILTAYKNKNKGQMSIFND